MDRWCGLVNFVADMDRMQAKARARFAFSEFLGERGKRCTPERLLVLDVVMDQRKSFTAEELLSLCKDRPGLNICRATLFNTLPLLVDAGFMRRLIYDGRTVYEPVRPGNSVKPRLCMVCTVCGKVHHSDVPALAEWVETQPLRGFTPEPQRSVVHIYGLCFRCRRAQAVMKKKSLTKQ